MKSYVNMPQYIVLDCEAIEKIAAAAKVPKSADLEDFQQKIEQAIQLYLDTAKEHFSFIRNDVDALLKLVNAVRRNRATIPEVARFISDLRPETLEYLRNLFPIHEIDTILKKIDNEASATEGLQELRSFLITGGNLESGRNRTHGKKPRPTIVYRLRVPDKKRGRPATEAENLLILFLAIAYTSSTGKEPSMSAHHGRPGPFVRMVKTVLTLVNADHIDAVEAVNRAGKISNIPISP
jgi:hypothetical protein